ncbi:unnamed protein product [Prunus armeniaca]
MAKLKHPSAVRLLQSHQRTRSRHRSQKEGNGDTPQAAQARGTQGQIVLQEGITAGGLKLAEKPPSVTTDPFPQPQVNMVNLNWPEQKRDKPTTEASSRRSRRVTRETSQRPKATISAGVVLCSKCKCESELEVTLDRQNQPTPSVFDIIGTSCQQGPIPAPSKDRAR